MELNSSPYRTAPRSNKMIWIILAVALLILAAAALLKFTGKLGSQAKATSDFQAVFLSNGQVYFGKLKQKGHWMELTNVYYLQVTEPLQSASGDGSSTPTTSGAANSQTEIKLVKLGSELHGPEDAMFIDRDKILFWENMKSDSKVMEAINKDQPAN